MNKIILVVGLMLILMGILPLLAFLLDYDQLTAYGKGYYVGKTILLVIGVLLVFFVQRRKRALRGFAEE